MKSSIHKRNKWMHWFVLRYCEIRFNLSFSRKPLQEKNCINEWLNRINRRERRLAFYLFKKKGALTVEVGVGAVYAIFLVYALWLNTRNFLLLNPTLLYQIHSFSFRCMKIRSTPKIVCMYTTCVEWANH